MTFPIDYEHEHDYNMIMNIYITATNEARLRQVKDSTMSGLINHLLDKYFEHDSLDDLVPPGKGITLIEGPRRMLDDKPSKATSVREVVNQTINEGEKMLRDTGVALALPDSHRYTSKDTCKIHGTLLDARGRCLTKGCKYG